MIALIRHPLRELKVDLSKPLDISLPLVPGGTLAAWYVDPLRIEPVRSGDWTGSVKEGGSVNFNNIYFNPHGHGTHTECVGHIAPEVFSVNDSLKTFFFLAKLISIRPIQNDDNEEITLTQIKDALGNDACDAIVIRTLPNGREKSSKNFSNTNPPYLLADAAYYIRQQGIRHLLIDLPSVDRERDEGRLLAHKAFWNYPAKPIMDATITEFIYVDDSIEDGLYLLNLQIASFRNDASPSKPVLYKLI